MSSRHDELMRVLALAAQLRADGTTWPEVAERVGRDLTTVRDWPRRYPAAWGKFYARAEGQRVREMSLEAHGRLIRLMRSEDENIQLAAAKFVARVREGRYRHESRPKPPPPAGKPGDVPPEVARLYPFLMGLSYEQFVALLEDLLARFKRLAAADDGHPAPGSPVAG